MLENSFAQAAARHLYDANILKNQQRWDNAVYLAGYVVECSFKVLVKVYLPEGNTAVRNYGHDLTEIQYKAIDISENRQTLTMTTFYRIKANCKDIQILP